jgi:hypothetical protein
MVVGRVVRRDPGDRFTEPLDLDGREALSVPRLLGRLEH